MKSINFGKHIIKSPVFLAPLSGVTDFPFRYIVQEFGVQVTTSEMIASRAMILETQNSMQKLHYKKIVSDDLHIVQLAGCEPDVMAHAAKLNESLGADGIDINFGCPVKKIVNGNAGSALMKDEKLATEIVEAVVNAVKIPVSVKMRMGWSSENLNAPILAKNFESAGAQLLTIHGRTRSQMFNGSANWTFIKTVKDSVNIPVIANGDIKTVQNAQDAFDQSNADGIMIGRGVYGKPWIISEIAQGLSGNAQSKIYSLHEVGTIAKKHIELIEEFYGKDAGCNLSKKHMSWYSSGFEGSANFRAKINLEESYDTIYNEVLRFFEL